MASTFVPTGGKIGVDLDAVVANADGPLFKLGTIEQAEDGEFMYVHANGAITQYDFVTVDEDGEAAAITTANAQAGHQVCVAQVAFADNDYGWVATVGKGGNYKGRVAANCAADVSLFTTATAGVLDDAVVADQRVDGVVITTAVTDAAAAEIITAPGGMHVENV